MAEPHPPRVTAFARGLRGHCPRCGGGGLFRNVTDIVETCPTCGLQFEREDGYWLGSMIVIMALVLVVFFVVTVGGILVTWPDVPWTVLLIVGIVANLFVPIVGYGWAKTTWMGLERGFTPTTPSEEADAAARLAARDRPVDG
ncbi:DUF983 domain-containing protein [Salsipaludibacter albus]|uniref:DUF983 domain-containing protein n=1 Tax=Salsipaludibacter albus TaxID=2849650 RepID=UPI001EE48A47|nr:DUF983 domain-containing protein [Salsipaludibacter albus]MBY5161890.1 DUF983 domain-containing protein [Salsipaludibacter albus]